MAINVYMQNQGFSKCIIRMFFFHKHIMEYGICVKTQQFLLLWHLNIEIKADYRKTKLWHLLLEKNIKNSVNNSSQKYNVFKYIIII